MSVFKVSSLVDKATADDDFPPKGIVLAEAVQLSRQDPANAAKFVKTAMKRLETPVVNVKVKTLKFLLHLVQNGPPAVTVELKLHTDEISRAMGWRGLPHPTKGYEPYQDLKDTAQSLLDLAFSAQAPQPTTLSYTNAPSNTFQQKSPGISTMESFGSSAYGNNGVYESRASLEPKNLDPNANKGVIGFVKGMLGKKDPPASIYGQYSNTSPNTSPYVQQQSFINQPQIPQGNTYNQSFGGYNSSNTTPYDVSVQGMYNQPPPSQQPFASPQMMEPPPRAQIPRIDADVNWKARKPEFQPQAEQRHAETPTTAFLKLSAQRALPTKAELLSFQNAMKGENIIELGDALKNPDWKIKVRALYGLEAAGEKFGFGAIAHLKPDIEEFKGAPQTSLRSRAQIVLSKLEGVEPTGIPEEPSAFDFANEQ